MSDTYKALVIKEESNGSFEQFILDWPLNKLPENDVLVRVHYSSLNYKDALSATGNKGVTKLYPHIPGIDAAGIVEQSSSEKFGRDDAVIVTGYDLGQNTFGGFGQYIRIPAQWIVPLPEGLSLRESMILGTAGFTAAIGTHHLQHNNINPAVGPVLITGATGGVGVLAISILSKIGFNVTAATGKTDQQSFLKKVGASSVIHRDKIQDHSDRPLLSGRWAGVLDTVGGHMLDTAIRQTKQGGTVTCCGNILGHKLQTDVYPFILRGINLAGISSQNCAMKLRKELWAKLATAWRPPNLEFLSKEVNLTQLGTKIDQMLKGKQVGRVLVNLKS